MKGLVVLAAAARSPMTIPDQQREQFLNYIDEHYDEFVKQMFQDMSRDSAQRVAVHAQASLVAPVTMKAYLRELLVLDASSAVKNLKLPMLYIGGEKNWPADQGWPEMAKKFGYDEAADISWRRIGASGHYVTLDQPDSVAVAITDFVAKSLAAPAAKK
jgi:pimeloyl-ACP methyl ester carboxylesterase